MAMASLKRTGFFTIGLLISSAVFAFAGEEKGGVTSAGHDHARKVACLTGMQAKPKSELPLLRRCELNETQYACAEKLFYKGYPAETIIRECLK